MSKKTSKPVNDGRREYCGVFAIYSFEKKPVKFRIYNGLVAIQHRGQDSAGMAVFNGSTIRLRTGVGLVSDVFKEADMAGLEGFAGLGHVRYPTIGASFAEDAQPILIDYPKKGIAICHNGNIANYGSLRKELEAAGRHFSTTCDSELVLHIFADALVKGKDIYGAAKICMERLDGSYAVALLTGEGELVIFRDPYGIKPLCFGQTADRIVFASESVALDINDMQLTGDVAPGEVIIVTSRGVQKKQVTKPKKTAHCMFEYVYFARPDSVLDGKLVYDARVELGKRLAMAGPAKADVVVAVPDTARPAAEGYARQSGIPIAEGLIKNRYVGRTFIMPSQGKRKDAVKLKLNAVRSLVKSKRVVLIDDSIVRGTNSGPIIKLLRDAGAREVHVRITCPPIRGPCFYGIDIPTFEELIANKKNVEEIRKHIGADSLVYLPIEQLYEALGFKKEELCVGCLTAEYITPVARKIAERIRKEGAKKGLRAWEEAF